MMLRGRLESHIDTNCARQKFLVNDIEAACLLRHETLEKMMMLMRLSQSRVNDNVRFKSAQCGY